MAALSDCFPSSSRLLIREYWNLVPNNSNNGVKETNIHLCPGLHANAKIAIFAKNRKNRKLFKEEDKSPTRTRDFGENCDFCDFSQKSLKSPPFSGTCVLYHFSVVPCLRF